MLKQVQLAADVVGLDGDPGVLAIGWALAEAGRVLQPGGVLYVLDIGRAPAAGCWRKRLDHDPTRFQGISVNHQPSRSAPRPG